MELFSLAVQQQLSIKLRFRFCCNRTRTCFLSNFFGMNKYINIAGFHYFFSCAEHLSYDKSPLGGKCFQFYRIMEFSWWKMVWFSIFYIQPTSNYVWFIFHLCCTSCDRKWFGVSIVYTDRCWNNGIFFVQFSIGKGNMLAKRGNILFHISNSIYFDRSSKTAHIEHCIWIYESSKRLLLFVFSHVLVECYGYKCDDCYYWSVRKTRKTFMTLWCIICGYLCVTQQKYEHTHNYVYVWLSFFCEFTLLQVRWALPIPLSM